MKNLNAMTIRQLRNLEASISRKAMVSGLSVEDEVLLDKINEALGNREYDILNNRL